MATTQPAISEWRCANYGDFSYQVKESFHPVLKAFLEKMAGSPHNYSALLQSHQSQSYQSEDDTRFLLLAFERQWKMQWSAQFAGYNTLADAISKTRLLFNVDSHTQLTRWFDLQTYVQVLPICGKHTSCCWLAGMSKPSHHQIAPSHYCSALILALHFQRHWSLCAIS